MSEEVTTKSVMETRPYIEKQITQVSEHIQNIIKDQEIRNKIIEIQRNNIIPIVDGKPKYLTLEEYHKALFDFDDFQAKLVNKKIVDELTRANMELDQYKEKLAKIE